ncbi:MAG: isoaspartyl peptidase/L-asparaginase [Oligoflexia bacterium]|nr:isoaspartyl peptidase/L-asparaginase [Oligoflexia bacterium]
MITPAVILHGGVGLWKGDRGPVEAGLRRALDAAWGALKLGAPGEEALTAALSILEDEQVFNAGFGSCLNELGQVRCDATLMRGNGDFCGFMNMARIRRPSQIALRDFAPGQKLLRVWTDALMTAVDKASPDFKKLCGWVASEDEMIAPHVATMAKQRLSGVAQAGLKPLADTVGCVVRDAEGRAFSGTSTGGIWGKREGRVGDAPIVGAGVFADDALGGLSATGSGEFILASALSAYVISALRAVSLSKAGLSQAVLQQEVDLAAKRFSGECFGLICIPKYGQPCFAVNSDDSLAVALRALDGSGHEYQQVGVIARK